MRKFIGNGIALAFLATTLGACSSRQIEPYQEPLPGLAPSQEEVVLEQKPLEQQLQDLEQITSQAAPEPKLGRGDVVNISVYDEPDLSINTIPIRPDGRISFPLVGDVLAEGLSVAELNQALTEGLSRYILAPRVSVIVQEFNSQQYTIFGEVVDPGVYPLTTEVTITKALAGAGGLNKGQYRATTVELADLNHAFISRSGQVLPVDFVRLLRRGDMRFDITLQTGDYIYIPSGLSQEVYILGEVNSPMLFAYRENMPMSRTLALAEGFTPDADLSRIQIIRGALHNPTIYRINFEAVIAGKAREIPLEPGDIVYVPPKGLTSFARVIDKIFPSIQALQVGLLLDDKLND
jgi:protein involved in polysaccharide export with SLBB domain